MTDSLPSAGLHGLDRLRRYTWWFLVPYPPSAVAFGALEVLEDDRSVGELLVILGSFVLAGLVSVRWFETVTREEVRSPIRVRDWAGFGIACAGLIAAAIVANPFSDIGLGWLLLPGGLIAALVLRLPPRARFAALAGMVLATAVSAGLLSAAGHLPPQAMVLGPVFALVVASTLWIQWWSFDVARKLEQSRRVAGELAVAQERLRFAAELHDIQGHHLQVIALKSELAARLGPTRPEESITVMRDVQELARDALRDTRAVVAGYRKVSPHTEINNATRVLTAAGIRATARFPEADLESEALRELGLLIRESTTNILRHAKAERADFDMTVADDHVAMRIRNDGIDTSASTGSGTGLVALGERFERAGGRLEWHRDGDKFTVTAQLPRKGAT